MATKQTATPGAPNPLDYLEEEKYTPSSIPTLNGGDYEMTYNGTTPNYKVDYNNEQFQKVDAEKQDALDKNDQIYGDMIGGADKFYEDLKNQHMEWADEQARIQKENTDFTIEKIEQQKEQAHSVLVCVVHTNLRGFAIA